MERQLRPPRRGSPHDDALGRFRIATRPASEGVGSRRIDARRVVLGYQSPQKMRLLLAVPTAKSKPAATARVRPTRSSDPSRRGVCHTGSEASCERGGVAQTRAAGSPSEKTGRTMSPPLLEAC
jgi:hypothetical protein